MKRKLQAFENERQVFITKQAAGTARWQCPLRMGAGKTHSQAHVLAKRKITGCRHYGLSFGDNHHQQLHREPVASTHLTQREGGTDPPAAGCQEEKWSALGLGLLLWVRPSLCCCWMSLLTHQRLETISSSITSAGEHPSFCGSVSLSVPGTDRGLGPVMTSTKQEINSRWLSQ